MNQVCFYLLLWVIICEVGHPLVHKLWHRLPIAVTHTALPMQLSSAVFSTAAMHKQLANRSSEDAYFRLQRDIGVMDGVGDWAKAGVDSGLYARRLARLLTAYCDMQREQHPHTAVDVVKALLFAEEACIQEKVVGSCTVCALSLDVETRTVSLASLGDCGALLLRRSPASTSSPAVNSFSIIHQTTPQYHKYNIPLQMGANYSQYDKEAVMGFDSPTRAQLQFIPVQEGDIIILGSDGLFDNLFPRDITEVFSQHGGEIQPANLPSLCIALGQACVGRSRDATAYTPWAQLHTQQHSTNGLLSHLFRRAPPQSSSKIQGGKDDDITIVLALVTSSSD